jgi:hypothetical protein
LRPSAVRAAPLFRSGRQPPIVGRNGIYERSYNLGSTVSSLDSQSNSVVRMTLLGVFASHSPIQTARDAGLSSKIGWQP